MDDVAQSMRQERRRHLEEVEAAVAESELARTPIDLRLMQLGNHSIEVGLELTDREIRGRVVHVAGEIVTIETIGGDHFDVVIDRVHGVHYIDRPGDTRAVNTGFPETLVARLREIWTAGERCTIGRLVGHALVGDIRAVTDSHIELVDPQGNCWLLPHSNTAWVGPKV